MSIILSIVIPTYNGEKSIGHTLQNLYNQIETERLGSKVEVVVTDDFSHDKTLYILRKLQSEFKSLHVFQNKKNLGMDRNFLQSMLNARGRYVWFFGQDDVALNKSIKTVLNLLEQENDIQNIYVDYTQFDEQKQQTVCESMIKLQAVNPLKKQVTFVEGPDNYFSVIDDAPSFLGATIVRVDQKIVAQLEPFVNTNYIQYAYFILGLNSGKTIIFNKPMVKGLVPISGWQKNGNQLLNITVGKLHCQYLLNKKDSSLFPNYLLKKKLNYFLHNYPKLLLLSFYYQLSDLKTANSRLMEIFHRSKSKYYIAILDTIFQTLAKLKTFF